MHSDESKLIQSDIAKSLEGLGSLREHAEHFAHQAIAKKLDTGEVLELTEDEIRMIKAYRQFAARNQPGKRFKWLTSNEQDIVIPPDPAFLQDPRDVSVLTRPPE